MSNVAPDPALSGSEFMRRKYDHGGAFLQWNRYCQDAFARARPVTDDSPFSTKGFEKLRLLAARDARKLLDYLRAREAAVNIREFDDYNHQILLSNADYLRLVFSKVFNPDVDRRIVGFFGSEYFVHWFSFARTSPTEVRELSFLWHQDGGPSKHLKIMVYLNGSLEHGGNTEFLDEETSRRLNEKGYDFPALAERLSDLSQFAAWAGVPFEPERQSLDAGEGLMFKARSVLHSGILPTKARRYVLSMTILPSPMHWRKSFELWPKEEMQVDPNWRNAFMERVGGVRLERAPPP